MRKEIPGFILVIGFILGIAALCFGMGSVDSAKTRHPETSEGSGEMSQETACLPSMFTQSLHYTGEGMRYWYEEEGGFANITGIPYQDLNCKSCHVKSCDRCHVESKDGRRLISKEKARSSATCLPCHSRENLTFKFDAKTGQTDVHKQAGMECADCHQNTDVHGDGTFRRSMRSPGAVRASCENCHIKQEQAAPMFDDSLESHQVHGGKLACAACHVSNTTACLNCHFDRYLETGKKPGNFIPIKDWTLLINYEGQVTSGSAMTLVHENQKFLSYQPYFTHSVMAEGRMCGDCHRNKAVRQMEDGRSVQMVTYEDGQVRNWQGVVPVRPDQLLWTYLNKTDDGWILVPNDTEPMIQFAAFGKPLTDEQMAHLYTEY